jgi:hypothetical protein
MSACANCALKRLISRDEIMERNFLCKKRGFTVSCIMIVSQKVVKRLFLQVYMQEIAACCNLVQSQYGYPAFFRRLMKFKIS